MADILVTDLTEGELAGNGVFDKLMAAAVAQIDSQFSKNRITGAEYATVYLGSMQAAMSASVQYVLGEQQADKQADLLVAQIAETLAKTIRDDSNVAEQVNLLAQKVETEKAQTEDAVIAGAVAGVIGNQNALIAKQTDGFDRDAEQKMLKIMMDNYAIRRSTNDVEIVPDNADNASIDVVIAKAATGIGIPVI